MYHRRSIFLFCKLYVNVNHLNKSNIFEGNDDKRDTYDGSSFLALKFKHRSIPLKFNEFSVEFVKNSDGESDFPVLFFNIANFLVRFVKNTNFKDNINKK